VDNISAPSLPVVRPRKDWPSVQLFCTTRVGGVGKPPFDTLNLGLGAGDDPQTVLENRRRVRALTPGEPAWLKQVHGVRVVDADNLALFGSDGQAPEADAAVTSAQERVLAVLTADCLSVVISDDTSSVLGAAHAGWKGLAAGVLEETLALMIKKNPLARGWRAWVGPGIGAAAFQVGLDVRRAFAPELAIMPELCVVDKGISDKWRVDLAGLAKLRLHRMGVETVELSGRCTVTDVEDTTTPTFFSYRRDHQTGRMATLAWLEKRT
jgi:polyphenol oxidase